MKSISRVEGKRISAGKRKPRGRSDEEKKISFPCNDAVVAMSSHRAKTLSMSLLFPETTTFLSLLYLCPPHQQKSYVILHETTYETVYV